MKLEERTFETPCTFDPSHNHLTVSAQLHTCTIVPIETEQKGKE